MGNEDSFGLSHADIQQLLHGYAYRLFGKNYTEAQLARHFDVSPSLISKLLHSKASFPEWLLERLGVRKTSHTMTRQYTGNYLSVDIFPS